MAKSHKSSPPRQYNVDEPRYLLEYLLVALAPMNRTRIKELLRRGGISVNGLAISQFNHPLHAGDVVSVGKLQPIAANGILERAGIKILFEDDCLIVIDKPVGLLSIGTEKRHDGTAHRLVNEYCQKQSTRAFVVHRLDRETSGVLILAKSAKIQEQVQASWDEVEKLYIAVVEGTPKPEEDTIRSHLVESAGLRVHSAPPGPNAKLAVTHYRTLKAMQSLTQLEVRLHTGRKHQIRVHLADRGTPVVGDAKYGAKTNPVGRMCLHAWKVQLTHPVTGEKLEFIAPVPAEFHKTEIAPRKIRNTNKH
jgi:23S rRNA pseudouridine1911/1915/1917 synthase